MRVSIKSVGFAIELTEKENIYVAVNSLRISQL